MHNKNTLSAERMERLINIHWGQAPRWSIDAHNYVFSYYQMIFPIWPADHERIQPHNRTVIDTFVSRLSEAEHTQLENHVRIILNEALKKRLNPATMTKDLLTLILACTTLIEIGSLSTTQDPSLPLLDLFEAGYELNPTHGGLDVCYSTGMTTIPLPKRSAIEARIVTS